MLAVLDETVGTAMSQEQDEYHSLIRSLKQKWDDEDAARDELERRAKEIFLEDQANQIFAPIEHYLTSLDKVLHAVGASLQINAVWEHLGDQRLGRAAKVTSSDPNRQHSLDFTIQGVSILFRDRPYSFSNGIKALMRVITHEVEQFLTPR
jgi:hypothetical protein